MGGYGSGRSYHLSSKDTTSDYRSIDVRYFKKQGLLKPNQSYSLSWSRNGKPTGSIYVQAHLYGVSLKYKARVNGDDWADRNDLILIDWTGTNFGGERPWFICPASGCGKRVAKLYGGRAMFACRHCLDLAYESQRESDLYRAIRHVDSFAKNLDGSQGFLMVEAGLSQRVCTKRHLINCYGSMINIMVKRTRSSLRSLI